MQIADFLGILVVGSVLSIVISWIKEKFGTESNSTKLVTIGLSVVVGGAYFLFWETVWWATMIGILTAASTVYALVLKK